MPVRTTKAIYRGDHFRFFVGTGNGLILEMRSPSRVQSAVTLEDQWLCLDFSQRNRSV
jgi:hypothetical protein